jgi:hypothetical protein
MGIEPTPMRDDDLSEGLTSYAILGPCHARVRPIPNLEHGDQRLTAVHRSARPLQIYRCYIDALKRNVSLTSP